MHAAPAVSYPVGRSAFALGLVVALALFGLAVNLAWIWQTDAPGWRQALGCMALVAVSVAALRGWLASPKGVLRWDGGQWTWEEAARGDTGAVARVLDLQARLLLRWRGAAGTRRWLWLERSAAPADWEALRRAVYSRASHAAPSQGTPPAAER